MKGEKETEKKKVIKYVGETNRSGYERGREHMEQFKRMDEGSHILKHYLKYHREMKMEEIKIGMKIRSTFRSAIERQISEAVAIYREEESGTELMNSKAEYNRCKLPRLNTQSLTEQMKEAEKEKEREAKLKKEIRLLKKKDRNKKRKEEAENETDLKEAYIETLNEGEKGGKRRKIVEEKSKEEYEKRM